MDEQSGTTSGGSPGPKPPPLAVIPEHELVRCIGEGSYGQIWLVRNVLGSYRAAKVVWRQNFDSSAPFEREFRGIQTFEPISRQHHGLVAVLQVGKNDAGGYFYYVMEVADDPFTRRVIDPAMYSAKTLESELQLRGRLPAAECVEIALVLTSALMHLHRHQMVHRDIKPANIIFVDGKPKLADIGLVTDLRHAKTFVGTEGFMPPEGPGTVQADIYSLGKVLYEMATGKDRFDFPEPSTRLGQLPDRREVNKLTKVIHKACATEIGRRYNSAREFNNDLLALRRVTVKSAPREPSKKWAVHPVLWIGGGLALLTGCLALLLIVASLQNGGVVVDRWYATTNSADLPSSFQEFAREEHSPRKLFLVVALSITNQLSELQRVSARDTPHDLDWPLEVWLAQQHATNFVLEGFGLTRLIPAQITATCDVKPQRVEISHGNGLVKVFSPEKPNYLNTTLLFTLDSALVDGSSGLLHFKTQNGLIMLPLQGGRIAP